MTDRRKTGTSKDGHLPGARLPRAGAWMPRTLLCPNGALMRISIRQLLPREADVTLGVLALTTGAQKQGSF